MGLGAFGTIDVARTGATAANRWMGAIAHNMANVNTLTRTDEEPFRGQHILLEAARDGGGTIVTEVVRDPRDPGLMFDPSHPLADENGLVQLAQVDVAGEMSDLIVATRHYQLNLRVVSAAEEAYQAALSIGRAS